MVSKPKANPGDCVSYIEPSRRHSQSACPSCVLSCISKMALQMSSLLPRCKVPLSLVGANFQGVGVRFKHVRSPGSPPCARKPAVGLTRSPVSKFSTSPRSETLCRSAAASACSVWPWSRLSTPDLSAPWPAK